MVEIIVVNWNAGRRLTDTIISIKNHHSFLVDSVTIVDNASTDNSLALLHSLVGDLPFPFRIIRNEENRGFAAACNQGAASARSKYLLFLNPDTRLFENSLLVPWLFMERPENNNVGICGIQLIDETGHVSRTCSRFPSVKRYAAEAFGLSRVRHLRSWGHRMAEWNHGVDRAVDQLIGAFFFVRTNFFRMLNGFDERYFVYFEEVDFSYRANQAGYQSIFLANAQAFHAGGGSSQHVKALRLFYNLRSRLQYGFKHFWHSRVAVLLVITIIIEPVSRLIFSFLRRNPKDLRYTIVAYLMLWRTLPAIIKQGLHLE